MKKYKMNWTHFLFLVVMWTSVLVFFVYLYRTQNRTTEIYPSYRTLPTDEELKEIELGTKN